MVTSAAIPAARAGWDALATRVAAALWWLPVESNVLGHQAWDEEAAMVTRRGRRTGARLRLIGTYDWKVTTTAAKRWKESQTQIAKSQDGLSPAQQPTPHPHTSRRACLHSNPYVETVLEKAPPT